MSKNKYRKPPSYVVVPTTLSPDGAAIASTASVSAAIDAPAELPAMMPAPDLAQSLHMLALVMACETLRQIPHCARCDRPARYRGALSGGLECEDHKGAQASTLPAPVLAERLYALVTR